jgi:serine/threonine protein kinase
MPASNRPDRSPTKSPAPGQADSGPGGVAAETSVEGPNSGLPRDVTFGPSAGPNEVGTLGPYRVIRPLGRGGMGAVYLAVDTRLNRKLALKVMLPQFAADPVSRERFLREARAAAQVAHDNVVTVYEADERDGVSYIAMQFLQGYPLDEYLKKKGTPGISPIVRLAREAAAGLAAAHRIGLVHRDIKPANLWLEAPNGRVKVLDFGLAKPVHAEAEVTQSGAVVGTPAYMSPEQARGLKLDHRTDLFSLGAVLYRLCTGRLPFEGPTTMAVLTALAADDPPPVRELNPPVPASLADLVHQMLAKKPADRPATADEVARRLRSVAEELAVPTARPVDNSSAGPGSLTITAVPDANPFESFDPVAELAASAASGLRAKQRPGHKLFWIAVAVALVAALAVWGVIVTKKGGAGTKSESSNRLAKANKDSTEKLSATVPPAVVADADRKAAGWVLSAGGTVQVNDDGREIRAVADLPRDRFTVTRIDLFGRPLADADLKLCSGLRGLQALNLEGTGTTDSGVANLKDLTGLSELRLKGTGINDTGLAYLRNLTKLRDLTLARTAVSDAGLVYLGGCQELIELGLDVTRVTDAGLVHLKHLKNLKKLWLNDTALTDAGLMYLAGVPGLERLLAQRTRVTAKGVAEFQTAVPGCTVEWDGGTAGPKK